MNKYKQLQEEIKEILPLYEMAKIADGKFFKYYTHSGEDFHEPHFHVVVPIDSKDYPNAEKDDRNTKFKTVLKLRLYPKDNPDYMKLIEEQSSPYLLSQLSQKEIQELETIIKAPNKKKPDMTNYDFALFMWDVENDEFEIEMFDYEHNCYLND